MSSMACNAPIEVTKENINEFIDSFDTLLTDCDGVLWSADNLIDRANQVINKLLARGKKIFFVTNNSTKSRREYAEKSARLGFNIGQENILSSASVLAAYLKQKDLKNRVYMIGSPGLAEELDNVGVRHFGLGPDPLIGLPLTLLDTKLEPDVGAVVVAFDGQFSLPKILKAASYINSVPNCLFVASNTDESFPFMQSNITFPGTGCMVRAVETVVGKKAIVMGKPETHMFDMIKAKYDLKPERTIMVGDRCNTDILMGTNCGLSTLLVLTGVHNLQDVEQFRADPATHGHVPRFYVPSFGTLLDLMD